MKAYTACTDDHGEIVFGKNEQDARLAAASLFGIEPEEVELFRSVEYDKYAGGGLTPRILIEEHGWGFECSGCSRKVHEDEDCIETAVFFENAVFCSRECLDALNAEKKRIDDEFEQFQIAVLTQFPSFDVAGFEGGYPRRTPVALFTFPGARWLSKMRVVNKELVFYVPNGDLDAYNKWINKAV